MDIRTIIHWCMVSVQTSEVLTSTQLSVES